jgi:hypothetical protein
MRSPRIVAKQLFYGKLVSPAENETRTDIQV